MASSAGYSRPGQFKQLSGDARVQVAEQPLRSYSSVCTLDDDGEFAPIDVDIEIHAEPTAMTHVGWSKETFWICLHQHLLRALRGSAPSAKAVVVVVVGRGHEQLSGHEPCRFSVAGPFGHLREAEAQLSKALDFGRVARSLQHQSSIAESAEARKLRHMVIARSEGKRLRIRTSEFRPAGG